MTTLPNVSKDSIEEIKEKARKAKEAKDFNKLVEDVDTRAGDMLFILHEDEVDTIESVILNVLGHEPIVLTNEQKKHLVKVVKFIQGAE